VQNKWSSDVVGLHRRAGLESFQFPCKCLNRAGRQLKAAGRLFEMAAAETAKPLAPMTVLVRRTNSFMVSADRRCRQLAAAEARTQCSSRYDGARP